MKDWEVYEKQIFDKFNNEFPDCEIIKNMKKLGQFSKTLRQIDVGIVGKMAGCEVLGVIECKYFNKKVDVKVVEGFISFLEDVKANFGIIITNEGFSEAAKNWAKIKNIKLDVLSMDELDYYHFYYDLCELCEPGDDKPPAIIRYESNCNIKSGSELLTFYVGRCDWCNGINIRCQSCGCVTGIYESMYNDAIECEGGCGTIFQIKQHYIGHGMAEEEVCISSDGEEIYVRLYK